MDTIRDAVIARAEALGLTSYAIAKATELEPSTVKRYLNGQCSLNSRYVSLLCQALDLELTTKIKSARESFESGYWIFNRYKSGKNADALTESVEVFRDWPRDVRNRPRLGSVHRDDRTGGFVIDMPVSVQCSHPLDGKQGIVVRIDTRKFVCDVKIGSAVESIPYGALCHV